jgi:hypothetical protein
MRFPFQLETEVERTIADDRRRSRVAAGFERRRNRSATLSVDTDMIARTWRGWTSREKSDAYLEYIERTGGTASRETPGNKGFYVLRRDDGDRTEFVTISLWESLDSIRAFAGDGLEVVFYPEDDEYLADRERFVTHYEITGP